MKITLGLIVWNELHGCQADVPKLPLDEFEEFFVVDGGSTDGTVEYLTRQGIRVYRQEKPGLNAAYVQADRLATCDAVVVFFPKGTLPVEDLLKFRPLFEQGYELVIASRQLPVSVNEEDVTWWRPRKWAVKALGIIAACVWRQEGVMIRDVLHGFKGWRRSAFSKMGILNVGLSIDVEMVVRSYKLRIRRVEFPTSEVSRGYGETHFKIWPTGKRLITYLWFELLRDN